MINIEDLRKIFISKSNTIKSSSIRFFPELCNQIIENTQFLLCSSGIPERIYCLINNIQEIKKCKNCNRNVKFINFVKGYKIYCNKCINKEKIKKTKQTNLERYGVDSPSKNIDIQNKIKNTNLERYGVEYTFQSELIKDKIKNVNMNRYGVENSSRNKEIYQKIKQTNLERYGVEYTFQSELVKDKIKKTNLEKYGVEYGSQNTSGKEIFEKLNNKNWLENQYKYNSIKGISKYFSKLSEITVSKYLKKHGIDIKHSNISSYENEISKFLTSLNVNFIKNDRNILNSLELDFYLPEHKLAIEFDGVFWHSNIFKKNNYHLKKTNLCDKQEIQLLHIFENEWVEKSDIWKSIIKSKLGLNKKIGARKCIINYVSTDESNQFLLENHLQGNINSRINIGLFYNMELVSLLNISKSRFNKKYEYEIVRFCNKINTNVIGGFSKLFNFFINEYNPCSVITYADKRYSNGNLYNKNGFEFLHDSLPNYFYVNKTKLESRIKYQKHKLYKLLKNYDKNLSEFQNMELNGFYRIYDCGNKVYTYNKK